MTKTMKSYRLDDYTAGSINAIAEDLGVSQADVIALAVQAFQVFGVADALSGVSYKDNDFSAYSTLIEMAHHGEGIEYEIGNQIRACAHI